MSNIQSINQNSFCILYTTPMITSMFPKQVSGTRRNSIPRNTDIVASSVFVLCLAGRQADGQTGRLFNKPLIGTPIIHVWGRVHSKIDGKKTFRYKMMSCHWTINLTNIFPHDLSNLNLRSKTRPTVHATPYASLRFDKRKSTSILASGRNKFSL